MCTILHAVFNLASIHAFLLNLWMDVMQAFILSGVPALGYPSSSYCHWPVASHDHDHDYVTVQQCLPVQAVHDVTNRVTKSDQQ
jgi:hypothetical protein